MSRGINISFPTTVTIKFSQFKSARGGGGGGEGGTGKRVKGNLYLLPSGCSELALSETVGTFRVGLSHFSQVKLGNFQLLSTTFIQSWKKIPISLCGKYERL